MNPWKDEPIEDGTDNEEAWRWQRWLRNRPPGELHAGGFALSVAVSVLIVALVASWYVFGALKPQPSEAVGSGAEASASAKPAKSGPATANPPPAPSWPSGLPTATATVGPNSGPFANLYDAGCTTIRQDPDRARLVAEAKVIARPLVAAWFGEAHWPALVELWQHESEWYPKACNSKSGACGLTQALPCKNMKDRTTRGQVLWGLDYIARRFKNPSYAWTFWQCTKFCPRYPGGPVLKTGKQDDPQTHWY